MIRKQDDSISEGLDLFLKEQAEDPSLDPATFCRSWSDALGKDGAGDGEEDGEGAEGGAQGGAHKGDSEALRRAIEDHLFFTQGLEQLRRCGERARQGRGSALPDVERPKSIGSYEILELLGEGGMGTVYLAEQKSPVRRQVALKLINPGMGSRQVLRRFEAERQALALMEHSNIARVFDAGTDEQGHPYFVMEYVRGMPIDRYCEEKDLSLEERIRLFIHVCSGIQHAHQKGILHRDLKPGNILVTEEDGRAFPKIIDFGLARAMESDLSERSLMTMEGQLLGTPEYMAPEQATRSCADIDSRADIFSLGVVFYQLLTGTLPVPTEVLRQSGLYEMQRKIREEECPSPSHRVAASRHASSSPALTASTETGTSDAGNTGSGSANAASTATFLGWQHRLRGDLDWITMKALEKERDRRYASASEFAEDLHRYLQHEPVLAGPPSGLYRFKKLLRKHRTFFTMASAVFLSLCGALVFVLRAYGETKTALTLAETREQDSKKTKAYLQSYLQTLVDDRQLQLRGGRQSLERLTGWKEDFETQPLGPFPPANSLWTHGADNRDASIVLDPDNPRQGKVLRLSGIPGKIDGSIIAFPLDPSNLKYHPEFSLSFKLKLEGGSQKFSSRGGVDYCSEADWRSRESRPLFFVDESWEVLLESVSDLECDEEWMLLPGVWHSAMVRYKVITSLGDATRKVLLHTFVDGRPLTPHPVEGDWREKENLFGFVSFQSPGDSAILYDDIEVTFPVSSRPWRRNLATGHYYMRTPEAMPWKEAREWARRRGGDLVVINDEPESSWLRSTFPVSNYWIGLHRASGFEDWKWVDGSRYRPCSWLGASVDSTSPPGMAAHARTDSGDMSHPRPWTWKADSGRRIALLEFDSPPLTASALWWGAGCKGSESRRCALKVTSPPVLGRSFDLTLQGAQALDRTFLILGKEKERREPWRRARPFLDLRGAGAPGCLLFPKPLTLVAPNAESSRNRLEWTLLVPDDVAAVGTRMYLQAVILDPQANDLGLFLSNGVLAQVGHAPLGGDLIQAQSIGGDPLAGGSTLKQPSPDCKTGEILGEEKLASVEALPDGGYLVAGRFQGTAALGPKFPLFRDPVLLASAGGADAFLANYDKHGEVRWARRYGGTGDEAFTDLALGKDGHIYVAGTYTGQWQLRSSDGGTRHLRSQGGRDCFVARLSSDGAIAWIQDLGGPEEESAPAVAVDDAGCISLVGGFRGSLETRASTKSLVSSGGLDLFLAMFGPDGSLLWMQSGGGPEDDVAADVVSNPDGSVVVCGSFRRRASFPSVGSAAVSLEARIPDPPIREHHEDIFLARYSKSGSLVWLRQAGGAGPDGAHCLARTSSGDLLLGGYHKFNCRFGEGEKEIVINNRGFTEGFLARFDGDGTLHAVTAFAGRWYREDCFGVTSLPDGTALVCGRFFEQMNAHRPPGPEDVFSPWLAEVRGQGGEDIFLAKVRADGTVAWVRPAGGKSQDRATDVTCLSDGSILLVGYSIGPATFGLSEGNQTTLLLAGTFLARYYP